MYYMGVGRLKLLGGAVGESLHEYSFGRGRGRAEGEHEGGASLSHWGRGPGGSAVKLLTVWCNLVPSGEFWYFAKHCIST